MKASDLMIGDLVYAKTINGKKIARVCLVTDNFVAAEATDGSEYTGKQFDGVFSCIELIPLTPEILEKNGFILCENCTSRWMEDFISHSVFITAPEGYASITVYVKVAHGHRRIMDDFQLHGIHQLQHALRLAGIKKEIEV